MDTFPEASAERHVPVFDARQAPMRMMCGVRWNVAPAGLRRLTRSHTGLTDCADSQVAWDAEGVTVGEGDLAAQVEQCYLNIGTALAEAGGSFNDVAKLTVYIVDWTADKMPLLLEGITRAAAKLGVTPVPPSTLLGVAALDVPDHLVEIEATAVID
ncbi:RidA family protein [Streptomyces sp. NPDC002785]|uniref:RidA family protein n=1 Tax=Streptomyces sp. NPDC002785 TaxID=3154543 RepID=UPI003320894C